MRHGRPRRSGLGRLLAIVKVRLPRIIDRTERGPGMAPV
jgi:hypothetical protein